MNMSTKKTKMFSEKEIANALRKVAHLFAPKVAEAIINKNTGKHLIEIQMILSNCKEEGRILDVGGGMGVNLLCLKRLNENLDLYLIDKFDEYTEENQHGSKDIGLKLQRDMNISTVVQDFWNQKVMPYESNYFDIITAFDVIEHFPEPPFKLLGEIKRILKRDGTLIGSVPNLLSTARRMRYLLGRHPYMHFDEWISGKYYGHYRECTRKEWKIIIESSGFMQTKTFMINEPTKTKAFNSYHIRKYRRLSLPALGLWALYFLDTIFPGLRTAIYFIARPNKTMKNIP